MNRTFSRFVFALALTSVFSSAAGAAAESRRERPGVVVLFSGVSLDQPVPAVFDSSSRLVVDRQNGRLVVQGSTDVIARWTRIFPGGAPKVVAPVDDSNESFLAVARKLLGRTSLDAPGIGVLLRTSGTVAQATEAVVPSPLAAGPAHPEAVVISDDFEGPLLTADGGKWTIRNTTSTQAHQWGTTGCDHLSGLQSVDSVRGGTGGANLTCDDVYPKNMRTWLDYGSPISLAGTNLPVLKFGFRGRSASSQDSSGSIEDYAGVFISQSTASGNGFYWYGDWQASWYGAAFDVTRWPGLGDLRQFPNLALWFDFQSASGTPVGPGFRVDDFNVSGGSNVCGLTILEVDATHCPLITVRVSPTDEAGNGITNLGQQDFTVKEDGQARNFRAVCSYTAPNVTQCLISYTTPSISGTHSLEIALDNGDCQTSATTSVTRDCPLGTGCRLTVAAVDSTQCPIVSIQVTPSDLAGNPIPNLSAVNFTLAEDGIGKNLVAVCDSLACTLTYSSSYRSGTHTDAITLDTGTCTATTATSVELACSETGCTGPYEYFVPAGAHAAGKNGTNFVTDLMILNEGPTSATGAIFLLVRDEDNSSAASIRISIPVATSAELDDVVLGSFYRNGIAAAFRICSDQPLRIESRTYTNAPAGTYGQGIPGFAGNRALRPGHSGKLVGLRENARFRTNIGFVNTSAVQVNVNVQLYTKYGVLLGTVNSSVPPFGYVQRNQIFRELTNADISAGRAIVSPNGGGIFAYASIVDNDSGDPTFEDAGE